MPKLFKNRSRKAGLPPGSIVSVGDKKTKEVNVSLIEYDENDLHQKKINNLKELLTIEDKSAVSWINADGVHETEILHFIGENLGLHSLILEDILNTDQRPKIEEFDTYIFIVVKMIYTDKEKEEIITEQISIILANKYLLSFQEKPGDVFNPIRERLKNQKGKLRNNGTDYLCYTLIDVIVDNYFHVLESIGIKIEKIEEELLFNPSQDALKEIHKLKQDVIFLQHSIWPLREVINNFKKSDSALVQEFTIRYLDDVYDHCIQVIDSLNTYKDIISGLLDVYISNVSNKMNEVMKTLTIIATIFIPLTFLAGIYGMNFENMPELKYEGAYFFILGFMFLIFILMIAYFRKKRWL